MKKVSILWNRNSDDLAKMLYAIDNSAYDITVRSVSPDEYDGHGEEVYTDNVSLLSKIASEFNCRVER